jgi:GNAT superfamily N-acetyltransferase
MVEIRTFEDGPEAAAALTQRVWTGAMGGKAIIPIWSAEYFDWQLFHKRLGGDDYLVGAYDGAKPIGTLFAEEFLFRVRGREITGTMSSWLAVCPEYRSEGLGKRMYDVLRRRHLDRSAPFMTGWFLRARSGRIGYKFWNANSKLQVIDEVGCWTRLLDHKAVAAWETERVLSWSSGALGWVQGPPRDPAGTASVRAYKPTDLAQCLRLTHQMTDPLDLAPIWTADRLAHHLHYKQMPRTLVAEQHGTVAGFINYYPLEYLGRTSLQGAFIDLVVFGQLNASERKALVAHTLAQMREEGIALALTPRYPCTAGRPFAGNGFIPMPAQFTFGAISTDESFTMGPVRSHYVNAR